MKLLAFDTSTDACSVALLNNGDVLSVHKIEPQAHAKILLPEVQGLLSQAELAVNQLDGVVYGAGPGSFTGVRIAAATAQGVALGADVGVIGVSSLQAIAQGVNRSHKASSVIAVLDARMGEVYWGAYSLSQDKLMETVIADAVAKPQQVDLNCISAEEIFLAGSGADEYNSVWLASENEQSDATGDVEGDAKKVKPAVKHIANVLPNAVDLISLALPVAQRGDWLSPEHAVPVYLRNKVALTEAERAGGSRSA